MAKNLIQWTVQLLVNSIKIKTHWGAEADINIIWILKQGSGCPRGFWKQERGTSSNLLNSWVQMMQGLNDSRLHWEWLVIHPAAAVCWGATVNELRLNEQFYLLNKIKMPEGNLLSLPCSSEAPGCWVFFSRVWANHCSAAFIHNHEMQTGADSSKISTKSVTEQTVTCLLRHSSTASPGTQLSNLFLILQRNNSLPFV